MAFKGLFIGIDRYESPGVNWLNCAVRDAVALHALFEDNFGGRAVLLKDENATRAAMLSELDGLSYCEPDDVVVICFSGHGTETHELVPYDLSPSDFEGSAISLNELGDFCARIPARRLLLVLDCCFAGGMGAKAIEVEGRPRDVLSVEAKLDRISGDGRVILTAANPTERAWENPRIGHGFLTYYLIEALLGPDEVRTGDQISVLQVLHHVVQRVTNAARSIRKTQNPAIRGTFNDEYTWPVFTKGPLYEAAFPEYAGAVANADLQSLGAFGFPGELIASWGAEIPSLNQLQIDAINDFGVLHGEHLVTSAPTWRR
jgi:helicase